MSDTSPIVEPRKPSLFQGRCLTSTTAVPAGGCLTAPPSHSTVCLTSHRPPTSSLHVTMIGEVTHASKDQSPNRRSSRIVRPVPLRPEESMTRFTSDWGKTHRSLVGRLLRAGVVGSSRYVRGDVMQTSKLVLPGGTAWSNQFRN